MSKWTEKDVIKAFAEALGSIEKKRTPILNLAEKIKEIVGRNKGISK